MVEIATVNGPKPAHGLGRTLVHEHMRSRREPTMVAFPHIYDDALEFDRAVTAVTAAQARGVKTICDPSVMGLGRDVAFIKKVADTTGATVIVATGAYTFLELPQYFQRRPIDALVEAFVHDATVGIQNTRIRAGFLKCATDAPGVTPDVEKVLRAVARTHRQTGLPIMTHSYAAGETGWAQLEIFRDEGVDLARVMIGHSGDTDDLDYLRRLLATGCYLGMDRFGLDALLPTSHRNGAIVQLCEGGYQNQLMLSQDYVCTSDRYVDADDQARQEPRWSMTYLFDHIIPGLQAGGVTAAGIETMLVDNPRDWLTPCEPY